MSATATGTVIEATVTNSANAAVTVPIRIEKLPISTKRKNSDAQVQPNAALSVDAAAMTNSDAPRKKTLGLNKTRFSTRIKRSVLPYTGPGSDTNKPLVVEDDEGSNNHGELTQENVE